MGATVSWAVVDVTDRDALQQSVGAIITAIGPIEVLLACAGIGTLTLVPELDTGMLRQTLDVNVVGVAHSIEAVLPGMIASRRGHIIGVASVAGYRGFPWMISYSASKAALIAYLEALRPGLRRARRDGDHGLSRIREDATEHLGSLSAAGQDARARAGGPHLVRAVMRRPRNCIFPWNMRIGLAILKYMPDPLFDRLMRWFGPQALHVEF